MPAARIVVSTSRRGQSDSTHDQNHRQAGRSLTFRLQRAQSTARSSSIASNDANSLAGESKDLEILVHQLDEPDVADASSSVSGELLTAIELQGRRREHLADPIGREREGGDVRHLGTVTCPMGRLSSASSARAGARELLCRGTLPNADSGHASAEHCHRASVDEA